MLNLPRFNQQGLLLHKILLVVIIVPLQRLFFKIMSIESMAFGLLVLSITLFAILQIKPIQFYVKNYIIKIFNTKIFQKYLLFFLRLEDYILSPRGHWSIGLVLSIFVFSLIAQFLFEDLAQLLFYTSIYTVCVVYISLRCSKLFSSIPTSWEKTLRMIESNLEMQDKIPNRINRDYSFLYMTSGRLTMLEACKFLNKRFLSIIGRGPKPPATPEAMEGLIQLTLGTAGILVPMGAGIYANKDVQETQRVIAKFRYDSEVAMAKFQNDSKVAIAKDALEYRLLLRQQEIDIYKELMKGSESQLEKYNQMLKDARGQEKNDLIAKRENIMKYREKILNDWLDLIGKDLPEVPNGSLLPTKPIEGLPSPLGKSLSPKISSPKEWDLYSNMCCEFFF
jgi:hypothetical protein